MKPIILIILSLGILFTSCDKLFDNMEGDLSKMSSADLVGSEAGLQRMLANLYTYIPMGAFSTADQATLFANGSRSNQGYYNTGVDGFWNYTAMRSINKFIETIQKAQADGVINEVTRKYYEGEARFIRAYCYFGSVRVYGGVPIIEKSLDNEYDGDKNAGLYYPRLTEKETWDWVLNEFQTAADLLPESHASGVMRAHKYSALALKARAALWAASVSKYWNRNPLRNDYISVREKLSYMESSYANAYYQIAIDAAAAVINSGKHSLTGASPSSVDEAITTLGNMFQNYDSNEGLFGRSYKTGATDNGNGTQGWTANQFVSGYLQGTYSATLNLADEYDNYTSLSERKRTSGKIATRIDGDESNYILSGTPTLEVSELNDFVKYENVTDPFTIKDARFQAWVLYPGCTFRNIETNISAGIATSSKISIYPSTNESAVCGGKEYYAYGSSDINNTSAFYNLAGDVNSNNRSAYSFMIRKFIDPSANNLFPQSPWYDIRYSEVLLTYAEAVAESGLGDATLAKKCLNDVRHRAGFTDDVDPTIDNILHEWKVEFAFENKWQQVLWRRRGHFNNLRDNTQEEGTTFDKLTLLPIVDCSGSSVKYFFIRSLAYYSTATASTANPITLGVGTEIYYGNIPNYVKNRLIDNKRTDQ